MTVNCSCTACRGFVHAHHAAGKGGVPLAAAIMVEGSEEVSRSGAKFGDFYRSGPLLMPLVLTIRSP